MTTKAKQTKTEWKQEAEGLAARAKEEVRRLRKEGTPETQRALELQTHALCVRAWWIGKDSPMGEEYKEHEKAMEDSAREAVARLGILLG